MSSNLLKTCYMGLDREKTRMINVDELMEKRAQAAAELKIRQEQYDRQRRQEGFVAGIAAEVLDTDALPADSLESGNVIKADNPEEISAEKEAVLSQAREEAERILKRAEKDAEAILAQAHIKAKEEYDNSRMQARNEGHEEGRKQALAEAEKIKKQLAEEKVQLEENYQRQLEELEPQFVDTITGIYEHIFRVDLQSYRDILLYLISGTMHEVGENKDFLIHVSREDFPYVSMQKKQLAEGTVASGHTVEFVEDMTLAQNECLIETDGGIFDCSLGTQLEELGRKLRLLSYQK